MAETAQKICAKKKKIRYKKSDWYIDDFSPSSDGNDDKASLRRVIKQGKEAHEKAKKLAGDWGWVGEDCPELLLDMEMTVLVHKQPHHMASDKSGSSGNDDTFFHTTYRICLK